MHMHMWIHDSQMIATFRPVSFITHFLLLNNPIHQITIILFDNFFRQVKEPRKTTILTACLFITKLYQLTSLTIGITLL